MTSHVLLLMPRGGEADEKFVTPSPSTVVGWPAAKSPWLTKDDLMADYVRILGGGWIERSIGDRGARRFGPKSFALDLGGFAVGPVARCEDRQ